MPLSAGARLGPYEIVSPLGKGGMGEVYVARDTRLERSVALKILPPEFAADAQRRARFEREARTISQLNHPHICALYDVGEEDSRPYLVMELLAGESLARRLARGPLPLDQALEVGIEICEALDRAHRAGIIHRDLKPANIMLTPSGTKLVDFGLAKASGLEASNEVVTETLTGHNTIVGTPQYMAPEQFDGRADARSDLFALGAVLYEMVTGDAAFTGTSHEVAPPLLATVIETCLRKAPDARWQSAADVRLLLQKIAAGSDGSTAPAAPRRSILPWALAATLFLIAAGAGIVAWRIAERAQGTSPVRTAILPPPGTTFSFLDFTGAPPEISPDGLKVVFGANHAGKTELYVRTLSEATPRLLAGTEGARYPFWSADSHWIGYFADGKVLRISATGGAAEVLGDAPNARGGTWGADGTILFGQRAGPIMRLAAGSPRATPATTISGDLRSQRWPRLLPDGRHFLYLSATGGEENPRNVIAISSLDEVGPGRELLKASSQPLYYDGKLLFIRDQILHAQRLDVRGERVEGEAIALDEPDIAYTPLFSRAAVSISNEGTLLYQPGELPPQSELVWLDRKGTSLGRAGSPGLYGLVDVAPDDSRIAYTLRLRNVETELWVADAQSGVRSRATFGKADNWPTWASDGRRLLFGSRGRGGQELHVWDRESGQETTIHATPRAKWPTSWSNDGRLIFFSERTPRGDIDVHYLTTSDGQDHVYLGTATDETMARVSPDGRWVAYMSFENGGWQVYIAPFPFSGPKWLVPVPDAILPVWRADGRELFFATSAGVLYAVPVTADRTLTLGEPQALFDMHPGTPPPFGFDVSRDGQRFLVNRRLGDDAPPAPLVLVQNFSAELRRIQNRM